MALKHVNSGSSFERDAAYSRAVMVDGDWIFVSGTTGLNYEDMTMPEDVVAQCANALENIASALARLDSGLNDVVRVRYICSTREGFEGCWPLLRKAFGKAKPAATMLLAGLLDPKMKIEIECTARRNAGREGERGSVGVQP